MKELGNYISGMLNERHFTTEDAIKRAFPNLDKNTIILLSQWYDEEFAYTDFNNIDEYAKHIQSDLIDILDAASEEDRKIIVKAMKKAGYGDYVE